MSALNKLQAIAREARARVTVPKIVRAVLERFEGRATRSAPMSTPVPEPEVAPVTVVVKQPNWELRTQAELVDHIVGHYHERLRRDLPVLIASAQRVARDHANHPAVPARLVDDLATLASELEGHMLKEETVLFPMLRTGARGGQLDMPIRMMERDHDAHDESLDRIRLHTADLKPPADASAAWIELYAGLAVLETDLRQHIFLENNILFARALGHRDD